MPHDEAAAPTREVVELHTADGLRLVAELARPRGPVRATLVCFHPNPSAGGSMDGHLLRRAAAELPGRAGISVLRVNTRGTSSRAGTSEGTFDDGGAERYDLAAALDHVEHADLPRIWLLGWSFGADVVLRHGDDPSVEGAVLVSPALRTANDEDLQRWARDGRPLVAVVPEHDEHLPPAPARARFAAVPQCELVVLPGAEHLVVGHADEVLDVVVRILTSSGAGAPG